MSEEDYKDIIVTEGYHLKFLKDETPTHEKVVDELSQAHSALRGKPREFLLRLDSLNKVIDARILLNEENPNGDYKAYLPKGVIKVREVIE